MIRVGTSGFSYQHWKGVFYPEDLPQRRLLEFYCEQFDCVEINSSFYHLPRQTTLESWYERTPEDFLFVLKGSRYVSHIKRLKDCEEPVSVFYKRVEALQEKLALVLWQLPPSLEVNLSLFKTFLDLLPVKPTPVLEFRDPSWFTQKVYELLAAKGATLCVHDMPQSRCPEILIGLLLYLRFHGPGGEYQGSYPDNQLQRRAHWARQSGSRDIYAFFNNDIGGYAVQNAATFRELLQS